MTDTSKYAPYLAFLTHANCQPLSPSLSPILTFTQGCPNAQARPFRITAIAYVNIESVEQYIWKIL